MVAKKAAPAPETITAPAVKPAGKAAKYVTVACKLPNGLELQLCKKTTWFEDTPSGSRERLRFDKYGEIITIGGTAYPNGNVPRGFRPRPLLIGGYAMTRNVPKDFFEEWLDQNKKHPAVVSRMIYGFDQIESVKDMAKENADTRSGAEPLHIDGDGNLKDNRVPRPMSSAIVQYGTADEMKARMVTSVSELSDD